MLWTVFATCILMIGTKLCKVHLSEKVIYQKYQKGPKTDSKLFFYEHKNHKTSCKQCVFVLRKGTLHQNVHAAMYRLPKQSKALFLVPKCCKFAACAKKHIKQFCASPTSKRYTKLVSTYGKYQIVPCSQVQVAKK